MAFVIGTVCVLLLVLLGRLAALGLPAMAAGCADPSCAVGRVIVSPFTTVPSALIALAAGGVFAPWLWGMGDLEGPFRTRLLATGVWYRERELVTLVQTRLREQRRSPMDVDIILEIADDLLRTFHGVSPAMTGAPDHPEQDNSGSATSRKMHARFLAHTYRVRKRPGATMVAQRSVVETVALYTMEKLEAAERRWPWRRRFFELLP